MVEPLILQPFQGSLVNQEWSDRVVTGAYDSFSPAERAAIIASNPYSYLNVTRSPEDVTADVSKADLLAGCREALHRIVAAGAFHEETEPALFLYRLELDGHHQTGIVGVAPLDAYRSGQIGVHEAVRNDRVQLLADHSTFVEATSSPVALAFDASPEALELIADLTRREPDLTLRTGRVQQAVWRVTGDTATTLAHAAATPRAYVTDGHHRAAAANAAAEPGLLVVLFPMTDMRVYAFHRLLGDRRGIGAAELPGAIGPDFVVEEVETPVIAPDPACFGIYLQRRWFYARFVGQAGESARSRLDVAILQERLLAPTFGVSDPSSERSLRYVSGLVAIDELAHRCDLLDGVAFVVHPTTVEQLIAVTDENDVMPPKSSYFAPKPQSGLFVHWTRNDRLRD